MHIAAFRPFRYNPAKISFISRVVAPPYDVISDEQAARLYKKDPHNVVRLTLGKPDAEDRPLRQYAQAAETLARWRRNGVLQREDVPVVYVCEQRFDLLGETRVRRGVLCALQLDDSPEGRALPHENTLAGPRADRERLMTACRASLSPIFGIFSDPQAQADALIENMASGMPLYEFCSEDGVAQRVWRVTDANRIGQLVSLLRPQQLFIADGHHRYQTACAYRAKHRDPAVPPGRAPEDYALAFCVSLENPGLVTLPTHRLVKAKASFDAARFVEGLGPLFDVESIRVDGPGELQDAAQRRIAGENRIGCLLPGALHLLTPKPDEAFAAFLPKRCLTWRRLPVALLHYGVLQPAFDIPADVRAEHPRLAYTQDVERMYWNIEGGKWDAAFLLPPSDPATVQTIARAGEKMPPKSTYFYPKIDTGLAIYTFDREACPSPPAD